MEHILHPRIDQLEVLKLKLSAIKAKSVENTPVHNVAHATTFFLPTLSASQPVKTTIMTYPA